MHPKPLPDAGFSRSQFLFHLALLNSIPNSFTSSYSTWPFHTPYPTLLSFPVLVPLGPSPTLYTRHYAPTCLVLVPLGPSPTLHTRHYAPTCPVLVPLGPSPTLHTGHYAPTCPVLVPLGPSPTLHTRHYAPTFPVLVLLGPSPTLHTRHYTLTSPVLVPVDPFFYTSYPTMCTHAPGSWGVPPGPSQGSPLPPSRRTSCPRSAVRASPQYTPGCVRRAAPWMCQTACSHLRSAPGK